MDHQNALAVIRGINIPAEARTLLNNYDKELAPGIDAPFDVITYKGGHWGMVSRGNRTIFERKTADGRPDGYEPFLYLVLLNGADHHSKVYYAKTYQDGDDDMPDCWSTDGLKPDAAVPAKT